MVWWLCSMPNGVPNVWVWTFITIFFSLLHIMIQIIPEIVPVLPSVNAKGLAWSRLSYLICHLFVMIILWGGMCCIVLHLIWIVINFTFQFWSWYFPDLKLLIWFTSHCNVMYQFSNTCMNPYRRWRYNWYES
jgi:hypothetical protein